MDAAAIRQLAMDIVDGKVFGSWMLPEDEPNLMLLVFLPLALGAAEKLPPDVSCLYQYYEKARSRAVNGCPTFDSFCFLTQADRNLLTPMIEHYKTLKEEFLHVRDSGGDSPGGLTEQPCANQD